MFEKSWQKELSFELKAETIMYADELVWIVP